MSKRGTVSLDSAVKQPLDKDHLNVFIWISSGDTWGDKVAFP